jgi:RND family efflux transporter MFP subunit
MGREAVSAMNYDSRIDQPHTDLASEAAATSSRRKWLLAGAGGLAVLVGIWFAIHHGKPAAGTDVTAQAPVVSVAIPGHGAVMGTISVTGVLAARHEMPIGSVGEGGSVRAVLVDAGQWVKKGQIMAVIDRSVQSQQHAGQAAQIAAAEADARIAQSNLDRGLKLVDRGFISKADIDRLTATRDGANARVGLARAQLGEIDARIHRLSITAPEDGLVLERDIEPGQVVASGILFRVAQGGEMEMRARVGENDLARLALGQSARVTPVGAPGSYIGHVWQLSPMIDPNSRQGTARIALPYAPGIRPGGFASAAIDSGSVSAPVLPESAILSDDGGSYVYVVGANNKVRRQPVTTGLVSERGIAIASGLSGRERVVLRAGGFLNPGDLVRPVMAGTAGDNSPGGE